MLDAPSASFVALYRVIRPHAFASNTLALAGCSSLNSKGGADGSSSSSSSTAAGVTESLAATGTTVVGSCADSHSSSTVRSRTDGSLSPAAATAVNAIPQPAQQLRCRVVQSWDAAWLAYFDTDDNIIYINCWRWAKDVSPDAPVNCEGVVCLNRLQMLMHTLAHELVHAVVFHLFPDIDRCCPAYTVNNRHGPIFHLLNKQLFGHSSDALENVLLLPSRAC